LCRRSTLQQADFGVADRRIREQLQFGAKLVWLLDPEARNVTVYRLRQDYQVLEDNEELTGDEVLPEFRCKVSELFDLPGQ